MLIAVVIGGHGVVLALFAMHHVSETDPPADERMTVISLDPIEDTSTPPRIGNTHSPAATRRPALTSAASPANEASTIAVPDAPPDVDWYAHGTDAAQRAAAEPTTRGFGFPKHEPAPREKKEFHWDKTHTERVHALEGGGIGVHLSDNCELVIAPFPMAGCAIGKRKARGDLFDEMKAPVEPGDWKDR